MSIRMVAAVLCIQAALGAACALDVDEPDPEREAPPTQQLPASVERVTYHAEGLGQERRYLLHVPEGLEASDRCSLVLVLPGIGADPARTLTVLPDLLDAASRHGFALVAADSTGYLGDSRFVRDNDLNELHADYLFGLMEHVAARLDAERGLEVDRRFVVGTSAGGAGAWQLVLTRPEFWSGLGLVAPAGLAFEHRIEDLGHLRIGFLQGDRDTAIDVEWNRRAARRLGEAGIEVRMIEVSGAGHRVARTEGLPELFEFLLW